MTLNPFTRRDNPHLLVVSMTGVKMGDRLLQIGCAHGGRLAAVARKVGLSGRAVLVAPDESSAARARKGAADAGVLVEIAVAPPTCLPDEDASFDLVVVDETSGLLATMRAEDRGAAIREIARVLRPGGRAVMIGAAPRGGLGALFTRAHSGPPFVASGQATVALEAEGFKSARTLAERDGLVFVEGIKPREGG
ncbi:MAG: methyltransferase domain-containing protein [Acidobacteria bacterium]|nr:methyltransferase domain-containing protein [Acidobacteriota bacterium]